MSNSTAKKSTGSPKRRVGRPTEYTQERLGALAVEILAWFKDSKNLWLKDFAHLHGVTWQSMCEHAAKSVEFSEAIKLCQEMQESKLFKLGLSKQVNAAMPIFALKNCAGWTDKQDVSFKDVTPFREFPTDNGLHDAVAKLSWEYEQRRKKEGAS